jgi:hypothetical protein
MIWNLPTEGLATAVSQSPDIWHIPLGSDGMMEVWQQPAAETADADGDRPPGWYSRWRNTAGAIGGEFGPYAARSEAIERAVLAWYGGGPPRT